LKVIEHFMGNTELVLAVAVFLGCIVRVMLPYLRKAKETGATGLKFETKYIASALIAIIITIWTVVEAVGAMPTMAADAPLALLISTGLVYGYAFQSFANKIAESWT